MSFLLVTEEKNRHDPSVREWVSQVINADKMDHFELIHHSLSIDATKLSHSICGFIMNIPGFVHLYHLKAIKMLREELQQISIIVICTDYTASKVHLRFNPHSTSLGTT